MSNSSPTTDFDGLVPPSTIGKTSATGMRPSGRDPTVGGTLFTTFVRPRLALVDAGLLVAAVTAETYRAADRAARYRRISSLVELLCTLFGSSSACSSGMTRCASCLPSSTPHWSNEPIDQSAPWVNTLCSYRATSWPSTYGVSLSIRNVDDGRLPSNTLNGTRSSATPSARTCSA